MTLRRLSASALLAPLLLLGAREAAAQEVQRRDIDLPKFNPAPAGDRFFGVPSPYAAGEITFHSAATLDYARRPLTYEQDGEELGVVVSDQLHLNLGVTLSILNRIAISANMPFLLLNRGNEVSGERYTLLEPSGEALGDLRLGVRVRLFGEYHDPFQLGLGGYFWIPTGSDSAYVSNGSVQGQPQLLFGGRAAERVVWSVMAGPTFKGTSPVFGGIELDHTMNFGAGVGVLLADNRTVQLGVESAGGFVMTNPDDSTTNAEILGSVKWRLPKAEFLEVGLAAGPGVASGIGTPQFRGVFQFAYTPVIEPPGKPKLDSDKDGIFDEVDACPNEPGKPNKDPLKHGCPDRDSDKDGILDDVDACPTEAGKANEDPKKNGCPDRDSDKDGILDDVDACPTEAGVASDDPKKNGCPVHDKDGDGIEDDLDACPDLAGVATNDPKTNGCPPDTDGDGFRDDVDACPREKGVDNKDPSKRGCPRLVIFTDVEVKILEQVQFDFAKATIRKASDELLNEVAQVLKDHPEVLKIEVQGHTDNIGPAAYNKKLSEDRARAVMAALVSRGIDQSRLISTGYGFDKPIADNKTDEGRQINRRVQFIVQEKKPVPVTIIKQGQKPPPAPAPSPKP